MPDYEQIVLMRGWEGLADRLQILSHCIHYCKVHNAAICVDWRDYMWGQETLDFHDYFEIVGIPTVPLQEVLLRIEKGASISPPTWDLMMIADPPNQSDHFKHFDSLIDNSYTKIKGDILVNNSRGLRMWHLDNMISNLRLQKSVSDLIIERLTNLSLPFTAVHLRGTDRLEGKNVTQAIYTAVTSFEKLLPHARSRNYIVSDMKEMVAEWIKKFPGAQQVFSDYAVHKIPSGLQGTHQLPKEALDFYGIKKHELNLDTLTDFIIICFSNWSVGNSQASTFTTLSTFLSQSGKKGIAKWLGGWEPQQKPLSATLDVSIEA